MSREKKYVSEVNCETGVQIEREFTEEEYIAFEKSAIDYAKAAAEAEAEQARVTALKESAKAKLIAGEPLTGDEAAVLVI